MNETNEAALAADETAVPVADADRAQLLEPATPAEPEPDLEPVAIARETMRGDLVALVLEEIKAAPDVWPKLSQAKQDQLIGRVSQRVGEAIKEAVRMIDGDGRDVIECVLEQVTVKDGIKGVVTLPKTADCRHALMDAVGKPVLLVVSEASQYLGGKLPKAEPDQRALALEAEARQQDGDGWHASPDGLTLARAGEALAGDEGIAAAFALASREEPLLRPAAEILAAGDCPASISALQRRLKVGYNRGARILEELERLVLVSPPGQDGTRDLFRAALAATLAATAEPSHGDVLGGVIGDAVAHLKLSPKE